MEETTNSQKGRLGHLHSQMGDKLVLLEFAGTEGLNSPFEFRVTCLKEGVPLKGDKVLGQPAAVELVTIDGSSRWFNGLVTSMLELGPEQGGIAYQLELRPWLWMLRNRQNCRIFHNQSVTGILQAIFADHAGLIREQPDFSKVRDRTPHEYIVQYRESDFAFVSRLMERAGISYHFEMSKSGHKMVLTDQSDSYRHGTVHSVAFLQHQGRHNADVEHFTSWTEERVPTSGNARMIDYDFKAPNTRHEYTASASGKYTGDAMESFEWPGAFNWKGSAHRDVVQRRLDMLTGPGQRFAAVGDALSVAPGTMMTLTEHPVAKGDYVVLSCTHRFTAQSYRSGAGGGTDYSGRYLFARSGTPMAPAQVTPRARVYGPQTGVVIGSGEIDCDEYGRILVQFHWDGAAAGSMRCRVSQSWASNSWGTIFIPRIGMEVVVEFLEGDPDHPLVTGCVYNGTNMPPFGLPGEQNKAGWKSTSVGGSGYNSLTFDDTAGAELIDMHAQFDHAVMVEHDQRETVGKKMTLKVGASRTSTIAHDDTLNVGQVLTIEAGQKIVLKVGTSSIEIDGTSITVKAMNVKVEAQAQLKTAGGITAEHSGGAFLDVKAAMVKINS
ncbi:type VI secretion system Vgr family protein [Frigidibacter oleivorans]|uniref:type VI secretion system Vgr family protein n=1 Tax=Frigidibacter oleivorans TaxID=2487129 RepID=UPI000F8CE8A1|nr:type VI secretion system tip protein TssI/VgrG [Frigidibacter oleivorans]